MAVGSPSRRASVPSQPRRGADIRRVGREHLGPVKAHSNVTHHGASTPEAAIHRRVIQVRCGLPLTGPSVWMAGLRMRGCANAIGACSAHTCIVCANHGTRQTHLAGHTASTGSTLRPPSSTRCPSKTSPRPYATPPHDAHLLPPGLRIASSSFSSLVSPPPLVLDTRQALRQFPAAGSNTLHATGTHWHTLAPSSPPSQPQPCPNLEARPGVVVMLTLRTSAPASCPRLASSTTLPYAF